MANRKFNHEQYLKNCGFKKVLIDTVNGDYWLEKKIKSKHLKGCSMIIESDLKEIKVWCTEQLHKSKQNDEVMIARIKYSVNNLNKIYNYFTHQR